MATTIDYYYEHPHAPSPLFRRILRPLIARKKRDSPHREAADHRMTMASLSTVDIPAAAMASNKVVFGNDTSNVIVARPGV